MDQSGHKKGDNLVASLEENARSKGVASVCVVYSTLGVGFVLMVSQSQLE